MKTPENNTSAYTNETRKNQFSSDTVRLPAIVNIKRLKSLFSNFSAITGISVSLVDYSKQEILLTEGWQKACFYFHYKSDETHPLCAHSIKSLTESLEKPDDIKIQYCENNLIHGACPIFIKNKHIADIVVGQILYSKPNLETFKAYAKKIGLEVNSYLNAIETIPVINEEQFRNILLLCKNIAQIISEEGYQAYKQNSMVEILEKSNKKLKKTAIKLKENQSFLKTIYNNTLIIIVVIDVTPKKSYIIRDINSGLKYITNIKPEYFINKTPDSFSVVISEKNIDKIVSVYDKAVETAAPVQEEMSVTLQNKEFWWITSTVPIAGKEGNVYRLIMTLANITKQKRAEKALKRSREAVIRSEANLKGVFNSSRLFYVLIDENYKVLSYNELALQTTGILENNELSVGQSILKIIPGKEKSMFLRNFKKALEGEHLRFEWELFTNDHESYWYEFSIAPVYVGKNLIGVAYSGIDITERKQTEKELKKAKEEAEIAYRLKSEFLANVSHEIRTPLNTILGFTDILKDKLINDEEIVGYINGIDISGKNLLSLINDILDLSKMEAGRLDIQNESVNILSLVSDINHVFAIKASLKNLELSIVSDSELPEFLYLDQTRLRQILFNLIGNGIKFTITGGVSVEITFNKQKPFTKTIDLIIHVKDTGIGIRKQQQQIIFEPFVQQEGQSTRKYFGTGLGLSISKRLVEMMNGSISVESEQGKGSVFTVYLHDVGILQNNSREKSNDNLQSICFHGSKVLLAEDMKANQLVIKGYLRKFDLELIIAKNGKYAIEQTQQHNPDIILMDIYMPEMDGITAAKQIKHSNMRHIPIIALTVSTDYESEENIYEYFDKYLTKPVTKELLIKTLCEFIPYTRRVSEEKHPQIKSVVEHILEEKPFSAEFVEYVKKLLPVLNDMEIDLTIDKITGFALAVTQLANKYNSKALGDYGKSIEKQAQSFDIENIMKSIELYKDICEIIDNN